MIAQYYLLSLILYLLHLVLGHIILVPTLVVYSMQQHHINSFSFKSPCPVLRESNNVKLLNVSCFTLWVRGGVQTGQAFSPHSCYWEVLARVTISAILSITPSDWSNGYHDFVKQPTHFMYFFFLPADNKQRLISSPIYHSLISKSSPLWAWEASVV